MAKDKNNMEDDELIEDEYIDEDEEIEEEDYDEDEEIDEDDEVIYDEEDEDEEDGGGSGRGFKISRQNLFFIGGIAAMAIVVIVFMVLKPNPEKNRKANEQMAQAIRYFEANVDSLAMNGDGQNYGFIDLSKRYKGTGAGNLANYYLSVIYYRQKDVDKGLEYAEKFKIGDNLVSSVALSLRGYGYEEKSEFSKAAKAYEQAAQTPAENEHTSPFFYLAAARNYETAGKSAKALEIYKNLTDKYPNTEEGAKAEKYLGRVSK